MSIKPAAQTKASQSQNQAADPKTSAWVSANAGSGKTYVLVNRVIRLLLQAVPPERILCLTFTRAAAAEMTNRLYSQLSAWTVLDDKGLTGEIAKTTGQNPKPGDLKAARRLFARALETPGGLNIKTIHAFCESLLHRFPLEADIATDFRVLDETAQTQLLASCSRAVLSKAGAQMGSELEKALHRIISHVHEDGFDRLINEIVSARNAIGAFFGHYSSPGEALDRLRAVLGLEPGDVDETLVEEIAGPGALEPDAIAGFIEILCQGAKTDAATGDRMSKAMSAPLPQARAHAWLEVFFTGAIFSAGRKLRARLMTKSVAAANLDIEAFFDRECTRLIPLYDRLKALAVWRASAALIEIAIEIAASFAAAKRKLGVLDYDDLIHNAVQLLHEEGAAWVLYKLDGGLDHILVDEAQDTSPDQWRVIKSLADEFYAGHGARHIERTMFAVGDEKQSIYSFQGADPEMFDAMRRYFETRAKHAKKQFKHVPLSVSFRSSELVLWAVDEVFADLPARLGLSAGELRETHQAARADAPGLIEIWPVERPDDHDRPDPWDAPLDWQNPDTPRVRLAETIADRISTWLEAGRILPARERPIEPDDILILVRRRDRFVEALVRALKQRDVPVAGADRMKLSDQIAVMDLVALAKAAVLPDDDLNLACVLKSPLIELSEDELFVLAHDRRDNSLWRQLGLEASENPVFSNTHQRLGKWFGMVDRMTPFEFFSTVLNADGARASMCRALGAEANDPLDEFINQTLDYERRNTPSMQGFLAWFRATRREVKRDFAHGGGQIRIMTVHGAKGLEADIVILPDTCTVPGSRHDAGILFLDDPDHPGTQPDIPVWRLSTGYDLPALKAAREGLQDARDAEYHRLLYVAMTRARDWLIVCGFEDRQGRRDGCWYNLVHDALAPHLNVLKDKHGDIEAWRKFTDKVSVKDRATKAQDFAQPRAAGDWIKTAAPREKPSLPPKAPSRLIARGDDIPPPGGLAGPIWRAERDLGLKRGLIVHALLQTIPLIARDKRARSIRHYLQNASHDLSHRQQVDIRREVVSVLDDPAFQHLFGPGTKAEVSLMGRLGDGEGDVEPVMVSGRIDRLIVMPDKVIAVDFKTDREVPGSPEAVRDTYIGQLAAYRGLLSDIYPGIPVECALLWTSRPTLMKLPQSLLDKALMEILPQSAS